MNHPGRSGDIPLETPTARHTDVVPAVEDRSYVMFIGGALLMALAAGFPLCLMVAHEATGVFWGDRGPWLVQAHGWAQLQGWSGLFVAGMGLRLLPRFAGRRPASKRITVGVFTLLFCGVAARTIAQPFAEGSIVIAGLLAGHVLWAAGALAFGAIITVTLRRGRGTREPWSVFAQAGALWWVAWAVTSVAAGIEAASNDAYVPAPIEQSITWMVMLGAVGNFIWAVQSRSVPIFFGRKTPSLGQVAMPGLLLNAGLAFVLIAGWIDSEASRERLVGGGFVLSAIGLAWLAPVAGSCWGKPRRLRPRARAAARFVLVANAAAVLCGLLLLLAGVQTLIEGAFAAPGLRDAARHAFGVGVITLLIVGMAQLVAPFFALRRVESHGEWLFDQGIFWLLVTSALLRVASGVLWDPLSTEARLHVAAVAGTLAWLGLVLFAAMVVRAIRSEPRVKAELAAATRPRR